MEYIIKNQKTEYSIYLNKNNSLIDKKAAETLQLYLNMAFDLDIKIVNKKTDKCFILQSNVGNGISFKVNNSQIYLTGEGDYGSFDSIMEFLNKTIDLEIYSNEVISYKKNKSLKMIDEYHYTPSFKYRIASYGWIRTNDELKRLTRTISNDELFITGNSFHNSFDIIKYQNEEIKDEWLSNDKKQLCYSNPDMRKQFVINLRKYLLDDAKCNLNKNHLVLGMEDNLSWCKCKECQRYNPSDSIIDFVNYVEKEINKGRDNPIKFLLFAYYSALRAPMKARCNKNVGIIFAPIKMSFRNTFTYNKKYLNELAKWSNSTNTLFAWTYNFYTRRNLFTYFTFDSMKKNYRILANNNVSFIYDQTESYSMNQTGFSFLKAYLQQKLQWNVNLKVSKLIDNFFTNYFGNYKEDMKSIFLNTKNEYRRLYLKERKPISNPSLEDTPDVYSEIGQTLDTFTSIDNQFIEFINNVNNRFDLLLEKSKDQKDIYKRILLESVQYRYWMQIINKKNGINKGFNQFLSLLNEVGITHYQEGKRIGENMI